MGDTPSRNQDGNGKLTRSQIYVHELSLATANVSSNASTSIVTNDSDETTKIYLTDYFPPEKATVSAIGKCRRILVTIHGTTDAIYTTTQC